MTRAAGVARAVPVLAVALLVGNQLADPRANVAEWVFNLGFLAYAVVGALIVRGRPRNPVGWLFCLIGLSTMAGNLLGTYARSHSGATVAAWFDAVGGAPVVVFLMLAVMLFPTGHYLSRSWRRVGTGLVIANAAAVVVVAFEPGPLSSVPRVRNPLGLDAAAGLLHALAAAHPVLTTVTLLCPIVEVVDRFRRSRGLERQQLKWLALAAAVSIVALMVLAALDTRLNLDTGTGQVIAGCVLGLILTAPPAAAAVAILRYRLYDVDVVINRALVYGALTATLGAAYLGSVLLIGLAVGRSGFAVAVSTLAVAALFRPARARIQGAVDRRFYRRRYDAARTLEQFGARLRDELDLEALGADLRGVVGETVQPSHVSLWLRSER